MTTIKKCLMVFCMAVLCLIMAGIFLRAFTAGILVRRMRMDNSFIRTVLFDAPSLQVIKQKAQPQIKIDWARFYPFEAQERQTDENERFLQKIYMVLARFDHIKPKIHRFTTDYLTGYMTIVEWANRCNRILNWNIPKVGGYNRVVEIEDGQLATFVPLRDTTWQSESVISFSRFCEENGVFFLYVAAPDKIGKNDSYSGTVDFSNQNADSFLASLKKKGVRYIDLRDNIEAQGLSQHNLFYRTDHHWLAETGLWAAHLIAEYLNENHIMQSDTYLLCSDRYRKEIYRDWFLGSRGKKVTLARTTPDDFSLLYPTFETKIRYVAPEYDWDEIGDFSIIYDMRQVETKDYYVKVPYSAYMGHSGSYGFIENYHTNNNCRILFLEDSFGRCVAPFLALNCKQIDIIDLRSFNGSIKTFIEKTKPTVVIVLYYNAEISALGDSQRPLYTFR